MIGGLLSSLLLTLLLVPVVYVALAGDVVRAADGTGEARLSGEVPLVDATRT